MLIWYFLVCVVVITCYDLLSPLSVLCTRNTIRGPACHTTPWAPIIKESICIYMEHNCNGRNCWPKSIFSPFFLGTLLEVWLLTNRMESKWHAHFWTLLIQTSHTCSLSFLSFSLAKLRQLSRWPWRPFLKLEELLLLPGSLNNFMEQSPSHQPLCLHFTHYMDKKWTIVFEPLYIAWFILYRITLMEIVSWKINLRLKWWEGANCSKTTMQEGKWGNVSGRSNCK